MLLHIIMTLLAWLTQTTADMRPWVGELLVYIYAVIDSGDYLNDYLSHITDPNVHAVALAIGQLLVDALGL